MSQAIPRNSLSPPATNTSNLTLSVWCIVAAFGTYFCTYAFRKPFTAAKYDDVLLWGLGYKVILVTAQVIGYMLSKFIGIKVIAEMVPHRRAVVLVGLIGVAELALVGFGLTPPPYNWVWLFVNGLPLGIVFGLVLGFLEGRRQTEALTAGLCVSFILADGVMKSVGTYLLDNGVSPYWMPAAAGALFAPGLLACTWMLTRIPQPSAEDVLARSERTPMNGAERGQFFLRYAPGLVLLLLVYLLVTILRSVRADFAPEMWTGLGGSVDPAIFTRSELIVGLGVVLLNGSLVFVRDNRRAFFAGLGVALGGVVLVLLALGLGADRLSGFGFMVLVGLGLYLPYIAMHTTLFERLIAMTRDRGNLGYLMYLADAFGYLGYVAVMLAKNAFGSPEGMLGFFVTISWGIGITCVVLLVPCWWYFQASGVGEGAEHLAVQAGASADGARVYPGGGAAGGASEPQV